VITRMQVRQTTPREEQGFGVKSAELREQGPRCEEPVDI
jgi:hypothetical protein